MTREEQIIETSKESFDPKIYPSFSKYSPLLRVGLRTGFIEGAEWADETMIEKAIKWIEKNIDLVAMDTVRLKSTKNEHQWYHHQIVMMDDFKQKFRKAMEE